MKTSTCPLCEAACGILVETERARIRSVRGDAHDPFSRGYVCPKAAALVDLHEDPDRLRQPLVRDGSTWHEVSWREALDRAAHGLARIRKQHGRGAVAVYYGNPVAHNLGLMTHGLLFARALRTRNVYSASSADQLPQMLVALRMFGHQGLIPVPDLDRTDLLLVLGANPLISNGSLMTAPGMRRRLRAIQDRGGRVIVIDPRRTETARAADEHVFIRPGTDALWLAAMLHVVFSEGQTFGRLAERIRNVDTLAALVSEFPPERVASRTGVSAETTRRLALEFLHAERAACYGRVGMCTQRHGTLAAWLAQVLNLATEHFDTVGGMMFTTPAVDVVGLMARCGMRGSYARWRSRVRQLPEFGGDLPVATLADEIETEGVGRVRALITMAGNPVLSTPNGSRLDRAITTLEHFVAIDPYLNETSRHAHVILPPAPALARPHYDLALFAFSVRNVAKFSDPVLPRQPSERHDWEIVTELAARLFVPAGLRRAASAAMRALPPERLVDVLLRVGPHKLSLTKLRRAPHGVDLGALQPGQLRIYTRDGQIDLAPAEFVHELRVGLDAEAVDDDPNALMLIGRRELRSNNSWMHNSPRLVNGPTRCTLLVHPRDAADRGLSDGGSAVLHSETGSLVVRVEVSDTMMPRVVSLPHGWGHGQNGSRLRVAREHAGVSANDVTSEHHLDTLSGNAAFNGLRVRLTPASTTTTDETASQAPAKYLDEVPIPP